LGTAGSTAYFCGRFGTAKTTEVLSKYAADVFVEVASKSGTTLNFTGNKSIPYRRFHVMSWLLH